MIALAICSALWRIIEARISSYEFIIQKLMLDEVLRADALFKANFINASGTRRTSPLQPKNAVKWYYFLWPYKMTLS